MPLNRAHLPGALALTFAFAREPAMAAEVVWLGDGPPPPEAATVAAAVGATRPPLDALALRAAATDAGPADQRAWEALRAALQDARAWETRLDGELVIMRDLARPIAGVTLLPDVAARNELFAALAYQGFAVDRFFNDTLIGDERAAPYRLVTPDGEAWPLPWIDATALDRARQPSPYEIAEAPQRARYAEAREAAQRLLPALLVVDPPLPAGAALWIDGEPITPDATGQIRLAPGRHLAHVALDGHVLARADLRADPAATLTFGAPLSDDRWDAWVVALQRGSQDAPPPDVASCVQALGGDVVIGWSDTRGGPRMARVTMDGASPFVLPRERPGHDGPEAEVAVAAGGGWMASGDFYLQDPLGVPQTRASVNAGAIDVAAEVALRYRLLHAGVVIDAAVPLGDHHVALVGDQPMRVRPDLSLAIGVPWVQATGGFLFPYHPSVGLRAVAPLWRGVELVATGRVGLPATFERDDGTSWTGRPTWQAWLGVGWRYNSGR